MSLHPNGAAPRIVNLGQWRAHLLSRLRRQIARTTDSELAGLYDEVRAYPHDDPQSDVDVPGPADVVVALRFRLGDQVLALFSTVALFGTPLDITVDELAIELFFPSDSATATVLRTRSS